MTVIRLLGVVRNPANGFPARPLARVSFLCQVRGDMSTVQEELIREDFLDALSDPNYLAMNAAAAADNADQLLNVAEGELGLLVRKGPTELGFLHRMLQEQLAAEHISAQLEPTKMYELFAEHVGDPRWREVLLATMWRLSRPSELHGLVDVIRARIDETPSGLRIREILAEITFGPYDLPPADVQDIAPDIIEAIETHPYEPHRARLLDSVLTGLEGATTGEIVRDCLKRWTILVQEPSTELVSEIAQLPPDVRLSGNIRKLLVRAVLYPSENIAYSSAVVIARRYTLGGPCGGEDRDLMQKELLHILSDPPSGLAAAAALTALSFGWESDPLVVDILNEARGHSDESVRIVALCHTLGVLQTIFPDAPATLQGNVQHLSDDDRAWLVGHLSAGMFSDSYSYSALLGAAVSEAVRGQDSVLEGLVASLKSTDEPHIDRRFIWTVVLRVLADDDRVVDIVCDQLSSEYHSSLGSLLTMGGERPLTSAYSFASPHSARVAAAIEDRLRTFKTGSMNRELWGLAAIDRGPMMKVALLESLETSPWPHWAADALAKYFDDDADARIALHAVLMGDPVRASMVANAATRVLAVEDVLPRLLTILSELAESGHPRQGRYDIVASAIVQACQEQRIETGPEIEPIAAEALKLMPADFNPSLGDPRHHFAADLYPSPSSITALAELEKVQDRPLAPYLRAFRNNPDQIQPLLESASNLLCSLPAYLRARVCQSLGSQMFSPDVVLQLTRQWADEVSGPNKSIASLAFHRALLRAKEEGLIDNGPWDLALAHLGEQAACYGWDHEDRRRGAWVGMCECRDWSILEERVETGGAAVPVGVSLDDVLDGPDLILLQQLASRWSDLRSEFGDALLTRLSGSRESESRSAVWNALALVARQDATLQLELENAVADDPELLRINGTWLWSMLRMG